MNVRRVGRQPARVLAAALLIALVAGQHAAAQSFWELSPYEIRLLVAFDHSVELSPLRQQQILTALAERASATAGAAWKVTLEAAPAPLKYQMLRGIDTLPVEAFADDLESRDKVVLISVAAEPDHYRLAACELDCATRRWSLPSTQRVRQPSRLASAAFALWLDAHAPLARVSGAEDKTAILQLRAAGLAPADPDWQPVELGRVFQPIMRRNQRDGTPAENGIEPLPWTYLIAGELDGPTLRCAVYSGVRNPLAVRRRGRTELYALAVDGGRGPSVLQLRSRTDATQPLAGYEVHAQRPAGGEMVRIGQTDRAGELTVEADASPLRILYVKHGSRLLGRLPVVPGLTPTVEAQLIDDDARLRVEGQLVGLEEALIDLVARRELFLARIRARLDENDAAGAAELLDQLRRLPTREGFAERIDQLQKTANSSDPATQQAIDRLFQRTKSLLGKYLDVKQISEIQSQVNKARG